MSACFLGLDFGGTWIKGLADFGDLKNPSSLEFLRIRNPLSTARNLEEFVEPVSQFCLRLAQGARICGVVVSTAGSVDGSGKVYRIAERHLGIMVTENWRERLEGILGCEVRLINDAEAFLLGLAEGGRLNISGAVAGVVIGTGLGFSMVRDGRWWKPSRDLIYLGSVQTPEGTYDQLASATAMADQSGGDLLRFLKEPEFEELRCAYWKRLQQILATATLLFHLDEIVLGGGLVSACQAAEVDLIEQLSDSFSRWLPPGLHPPKLRVDSQGNLTNLQGALALVRGNAVASKVEFRGAFDSLETERMESSLALERRSALEVVQLLLDAENQAGHDLMSEVQGLSKISECIAESLRRGGRMIYVGAGTSGRLGALDAVEIPCTYGEDTARFVAVLAGGISDSSLTIESDGEEDHSAVPDMILLQPRPEDVVIGISASGTAYFVRSALCYSRSRGACTVFIHEAEGDGQCFFDEELRLHSGAEIVAGSTRMKAGTATKKILNVLSTTAAILLGRIQGNSMVYFQSSNRKLFKRAERILEEQKKAGELILRSAKGEPLMDTDGHK